jgi:hypothetical protein
VWSELTKYAGKFFWNMHKKNHNNEKIAHLIGQMANFKCFESYYSIKYSTSYNKPKTWWQMVDDPIDYLKNLAIKLFSITPHSVACERAFSTLGFLYGKRRQCLNLSTIEMMAKIRYYLLSNVKNELNYTKEETEVELKILVEECGLFNESDDEDGEEDNDNPFNEEPLEIPEHDVFVLIINNMVDMNNPVFTGESNEEIIDRSDENEEEEEEEEGEEEELDFEKIAQISAPSNM